MIKQKILLVLVFLLFSNCGYEPLYVNLDNKLSFKEITTEGNKKINRRILSLAGLKINSQDSTGYNLNIGSKKNKEVISKDKQGNNSTYKLNISVYIKLETTEKLFEEKQFNGSFVYSGTENKLDLMQYEKEIEKNIIISITDQINIFLRTL